MIPALIITFFKGGKDVDCIDQSNVSGFCGFDTEHYTGIDNN